MVEDAGRKKTADHAVEQVVDHGIDQTMAAGQLKLRRAWRYVEAVGMA
jgi:hypothetical protein